METIANLLQESKREIDPLEAELLLSHVLAVPRSFLYAHSERILTTNEYAVFIKLYERKKTGEPLPYLLSKREFWSLSLKVTNDTLIPRQETELLVESALAWGKNRPGLRVADLGTGAGPIAIALAYEKQDWTLYATDISRAALKVAKENAASFNLNNIYFYEGDWFSALPPIKLDMIIANPPYLSAKDPHLINSSLHFEPPDALIAGKEGIEAFSIIAEGAKDYLVSGGALLFEHGFDQGKKVQSILNKVGYNEVQTRRDDQGHERITMGIWLP